MSTKTYLQVLFLVALLVGGYLVGRRSGVDVEVVVVRETDMFGWQS